MESPCRLAAALATFAMPTAPTLAGPPPWAPAHGKRAKVRSRYDSYGHHYELEQILRSDRFWRSHDGRYHCRRDNGTT